MMTQPKIGLALGSGAARGWAHIGVIEALLDKKIVPDIVCGTSAGALVGAAYAADRLPQLRARIEQLNWREIASLIDVRMSNGGVVEGARIETFLRDLGISGPIEACSKRFAAVATDLTTGREIWLETGPIDKAVRASISIPGVFSPYRMNDAWFLDGGLVNPVPVSLCRALGADIIIAVDLNGDRLAKRWVREITTSARREFTEHIIEQLPAMMRDRIKPIATDLLSPREPVPGYFEVLANALDIMEDHITRARLAGEPPHVLLRPQLTNLNWMEFQRGREAIAEGRACVERASLSLGKYFPELATES
ncbi:MAG: patatin-like phospholipase family protein [Rhizomicrobium sp.]|jgi:NTE family protein